MGDKWKTTLLGQKVGISFDGMKNPCPKDRDRKCIHSIFKSDGDFPRFECNTQCELKEDGKQENEQIPD